MENRQALSQQAQASDFSIYLLSYNNTSFPTSSSRSAGYCEDHVGQTCHTILDTRKWILRAKVPFYTGHAAPSLDNVRTVFPVKLWSFGRE